MTSQGHTSAHQPTPARSYFLCSALLLHTRRDPRELKRRHLRGSLHAVKPNVNSWGDLLLRGVTPLIREQEEKEDREVEEKPGWGGVTQPEGLQSRVSKGAQ